MKVHFCILIDSAIRSYSFILQTICARIILNDESCLASEIVIVGYFKALHQQNISVSITTVHWFHDRGSVTDRGVDISLRHCVQTGSGIHSACNRIGIGGKSTGA
jgi:hypothetical protein